jgi:hypothetical protein
VYNVCNIVKLALDFVNAIVYMQLVKSFATMTHSKADVGEVKSLS